MGRQDRPDPGRHALETLLRVEDLRVAACGAFSATSRTPSAPCSGGCVALSKVIAIIFSTFAEFSGESISKIIAINAAPSEIQYDMIWVRRKNYGWSSKKRPSVGGPSEQKRDGPLFDESD